MTLRSSLKGSALRRPIELVSFLPSRFPHSTPSSSSSSSSPSSAPSPNPSSPPPLPPLHPPPSFSRARHGSFIQAAPRLGNQWSDDPVLARYLRQHLPASVFEEIEPDLRAFGGRVADDVLELHRECEANPPRLEQFDAWGRRVDRLVTCEAWKRMKTISAEEGLVAIAYENKYGAGSRLYQVSFSSFCDFETSFCFFFIDPPISMSMLLFFIDPPMFHVHSLDRQIDSLQSFFRPLLVSLVHDGWRGEDHRRL